MNWHTEIATEFARRQKSADPSVIDELAQHATAAYEAARGDGASASEAEARVRALVQSWCAATTGPARIERLPLRQSEPAGRSWFAGLGLDIRLALRLLRQQPGFAFISITMIALGIAATTSLFSVVDGVLLKPLPKVNTDGLVRAFQHDADFRGRAFSNNGYYAWADQPQTISGIGAWNDVTVPIEGGDGLELVKAARVTASLFPVVGIAPALGMNFTSDQEVSDDVVMLSDGLWHERFGGAADVLGKRLTVGGKPRTIVGVMPRGFEFPDRDARLWIPQQVPQVVSREGRNAISITISGHSVLARLKPGYTAAQAQAEAEARLRQSVEARERRGRAASGRKQVPKTVTLTPMLDWMVKDVRLVIWILSSAVLLLFAAAIGNVANMQLARATSREREVAIRSAMGAGGARLVRQLFVETSVVAAIGGAMGAALGVALVRALPTVMPADFPRFEDIVIDARVLGVSAGLSLMVSLAIAVLPARLARRVRLTSALSADGAAPVGGSLRSPAARSRSLIITGQVAIAALLLVGAGLLSRSLLKLINVERGYQPTNLLTARLSHLAQGLPRDARATFYQAVLDQLTSTPGVTHAALSNRLPLARADGQIPGTNPIDPEEQMEGALQLVSRDYLSAMGMRLVRGREFTNDDQRTSELVVLVNESFASRYLPGEPLDRLLSLELDANRRGCEPTKAIASACTIRWRVVGVVGDVTKADGAVEPEVYAVRNQLLDLPPQVQFVTARTTGDPAALSATLRSIVRGASTAGIVDQVATMETRLMRSLARQRLYALLLDGFAAFALLIAAVGLFGGLSYGVAQRTREIGVRTALGATPRQIMSMVLKQGGAMTIAGLLIGLGAAAATVRHLATYLFGIEPLDVQTFAVVGGSLFIVALVACAIPARRAARIDALEALRR